jgi:hypothetical protein
MLLPLWHYRHAIGWPGIKYHTVARDLRQITSPGMHVMAWRQMPIGGMLLPVWHYRHAMRQTMDRPTVGIANSSYIARWVGRQT